MAGLYDLEAAQLLEVKTWPLGRELASQLHPCLGELMGRYTWAKLGAIAIGCGPGSFTGTRLGVVTARILAQQLEVPLLGLSSLGTMAWHYRNALLEEDGIVSRRAQQGHQYLGIYRYQGGCLHALWGDRLVTDSEAEALLATWPHPSKHLSPPHSSDYGRALLTWAAQQWHDTLRAGETFPHWSSVVPLYGK
ncbi:MAG: tRNA (adenosine(37)-N6)-threonylcarbamoyltransferase complex dimerization subunit type 1 TsaB [Thermosynechococcus sp.]|uniref:tRNA (adenosine(37)-N6)-threonylcarbamoyltransferase complex dimerization subunit type 1 TsaB n=1 Tax=Thermosynechococcus sp. TaxID=2814275 RepID=UPI002201102E|nr:tRNA (adenosine(37)-N6)-threonylcarbamoyltransferase complex dimerization subunit type 1 TsaB [Thermosynechococcus sp.]BCX11870.1 MAG: tRNA (adenosine(37)-N6)-threonylcarbamoyltransferase complex dimerization subunit type 1 TsaB [Thermosynechococcus sp.]